ncbi:unannotated protein [freshwater metagenome]|uniref:Unannotated protein n=1 Tax=freshwater metagenome TaxID=449393 RepID=A0A6J7U1F9_9ZZZZ
MAGVALVVHFLVDNPFEFTRAALDSPLNRVDRNRGVSGFLEHGPQVRIHVWVSPAILCRNLDLANQLGKELASLDVGCPFFVFDCCPFGVAGHVVPLWC